MIELPSEPMRRRSICLVACLSVTLFATSCEERQPEPSGETPLITAIYSGVAKDVQRRLDAGADPNESNSAGVRPLEVAIESGQPDMVRVLIDAGAGTGPSRSGTSMFAIAALSGSPAFETVVDADTRSIEIIQLLDGAGADPCLRSDRGDGRRLLPSEIATELDRTTVAAVLAKNEQGCGAS